MLITQIMKHEVIIASQNQSLKHAAQIMEENDFDALPICINNRLVGIITIRDIVLKAVEQGLTLEDITIENLMTAETKYVYVDQTVEYALNFMNEHQLNQLLVLDRDTNLVGIVSLQDILKSQCSALTKSNQNIELDFENA